MGTTSLKVYEVHIHCTVLWIQQYVEVVQTTDISEDLTADFFRIKVTEKQCHI
jgi:hypothetical protein